MSFKTEYKIEEFSYSASGREIHFGALRLSPEGWETHLETLPRVENAVVKKIEIENVRGDRQEVTVSGEWCIEERQ